MASESAVAEEMQDLMGYIQSLPQGANPYSGVRDYLIKDTTLPEFSSYAVISLRLILAAHVILSIQSAVLVYLRLVVKRSNCIAMTRQGLLRPDMPSVTAISNFCYAVLTAVDLALIEIMNHTKHYISPRFLLCGLKYLFLLAYAWSYIWGCLCTCASLLWDERWTTQDVIRGKKNQIPTSLKIFLNGLFFTLVILPWPPVLWAFGTANSEMLKLQKAFEELDESSKMAGTKYNGTHAFDPLTVPVERVLKHQLAISYYTRFGMSFFLGMLVFLAVIYAPLLSFSFGNLRKRINAYAKALPASPPDSQTYLYAALQELRQKHRALLKQALVTYFTSWFYIPILSWELTFKTNRFMEERTRWVIVPLLLNAIYAVAGNM
ncbi:hypothetical protein DFH28DRAFT_929318 [Melampsora americana]|nr:hypothetical protein DFH28DRAFT_929318 [Melampsora americana]